MNKVGIVVGHARGTGAVSHDGVNEWWWNNALAKILKRRLEDFGVSAKIYYRKSSLGYTSAMKDLAKRIKADDMQLCLELHFNSFSEKSHGYEFLYWWGSSKSKRFAKCMAEEFGDHVKGISPRKAWITGAKGYKALWLKSWNKKKADSRRGAEFCYYTHCPAIICEPGFASNPSEWSIMNRDIDDIIDAYVGGIVTYLSTQ